MLWFFVWLNLACAAIWLYSAIRLYQRRQALDQLLIDLGRHRVYLLDAIAEVERFTLHGWIPAKYVSEKGQKETIH